MLEQPPSPAPGPITPEDIEDELEGRPELLTYFKRLPKELWPRHYRALERIPESGRVEYLVGVLEGRKEAIRSFSFSDPGMERRALEEADGMDGFGMRLQEAFDSPENLLGVGTTARVKSMRVRGFDKNIAIKFLLTPTEKTLSVNAEYDMLREVETITKIEEAEERHGAGAYIRVPHPYFFYKHGKLQCYGMSEVDGITLEVLLGGADSLSEKAREKRDAVLGALRSRFASEEERDAVMKEVDSFTRAMHEVCLHGDIKPKNVMIDGRGMLYLIDFGQSVSWMRVEGKATDQFGELQDVERKQMQECVRQALRLLGSHT